MHLDSCSLDSARENTPRAPERKASITRSCSQSSSNKMRRVGSFRDWIARKTEYPAKQLSRSTLLTRATSGCVLMISSAIVLEVKQSGRMVSKRRLRLLFNCPAISWEAILEASPTRTRSEGPSAMARLSERKTPGEDLPDLNL